MLTRSARQTKTDSFANSVDLDETAVSSGYLRFAILCLNLKRKPLFASMDQFKFSYGIYDFQNAGVKGLRHILA